MQQGLGDRQVQVHLLAVPPEEDAATSARWALDTAERERLARLRRPADQWLYLCAHTLLRRVLSDCAPVSPPDWRFETGHAGKPALCRHHHPGLQSLRFNLSHCPGLVAVVVARGREVGVDVEHVDGLHDPAGLATMVLTPDEWRLWDQTEPSDLVRRHFLLERWTLKEAALKAMGFGLGRIEPSRFGLMPETGSAWRVLPFEGHPQPHVHWWVCTEPVDRPHRLAIAGERLQGEQLPALLVKHWTVDHLHPSRCTPCPSSASVSSLAGNRQVA
ncbi:4'-phosphopantetheinyl transferase family protein [Sphaerotilus sp.]|uniref:4'-phosphopantetheinyl transferase family protein n=1 Tax=Sphaerotilus sp. TaxID=2093942 RepID=UPI002ACD8ABB|nr:4'-phosphopantetheinyl transferase superfamily protein [Sphaerotilus sp.]MDZ7856963.1 4'-phosphopantetheinyl transferase superfamily protein [Sphaerotilus sp.]